MRRVEIFIGGEWLPVLIQFNPNWFSLCWTDCVNDYDFFPFPDFSPQTSDEFWSCVTDILPELMLGDGQDYVVNYPYSRLPAWRECKE